MQTHKGMTNLELARLMRAVAAALQINSKLPVARFQVIAYQNAADAIEHLTSEAKDLWDTGELEKIPGVGKTIAERLDELFRTGKVKYFEETFDGLPPAMFELMDVPGIGAKRAYRLSRELGITKAHGALQKLAKAATNGRIQELEGFGEQIEKEILESVGQVKERNKRLLLPYATIIAEELIEYMKKNSHVMKIEPLGSLRRRVSTVGDIDIAVATDHPKEIIDHFVNYPKKQKLIEKGPISSSLLLPGGVQVDLMVQPENHFGALLQHFTGSKHHNVALRTYALKKGLSLSEKGIKRKMTNGKLKMENYKTEESFYEALGLQWVPPEIREDDGEIEASLRSAQGLPGGLPKLVELEDIKGDLHMHSNFPAETSHDAGVDAMAELAAVGEALGYEYMGFSEHNPKQSESEAKVLHTLKKKQQMVQIINDKLGNDKFKVFNGLEVDIQPSGKLSLTEKGFDTLDYAIVSIHSSFRGSRDEQTKRVLAGLEHPKVRIFGHPTGRKLNEREGIELSWEKIFEYCLKNNKWVEINSSPDRLDLPDILVRDAVKARVKLIISTDSHSKDWLPGMRYGVSVARRGWAQEKDVVNTLGADEFEKLLREEK